MMARASLITFLLLLLSCLQETSSHFPGRTGTLVKSYKREALQEIVGIVEQSISDRFSFR